MGEHTSFFKCELKFFIALLIGIFLLNIVAIIFQKLFNVGLFISTVISAIVLCIYLIYFIYLVIKVKIFNSEYKCQDIRQRLSNWLSNFVS